MTETFYRVHVEWDDGVEHLYTVVTWEIGDGFLHLVLADRDLFIPFTSMQSWWFERP